MSTSKNINNLQIAEILRDVAAGYQLKDDKSNKFKIVAYERAADAVEHASSELKDLWDDGKLDDVPGIGSSIASHLDELFKTGKSNHFEEILKGIPKEAFKLMLLPGIGIKTAMKLLKEGPKEEVEEKLKQALELEKKEKRMLLPYASLLASEIMDYMLVNKSVKKIEPLGSLRRKAATVGDLDFAVATSDPIEVLNYFSKYPKAVKVIEKGEHSASILLPNNIQVDLIAQELESFGSLLQHFTGSKHHNIALREHALKKGLSLNEYGIKKVGEDPKVAKYKEFETEEKFYKYLGLEWVPPELREDAGEIEAALNNKLPNLIELKDIKADLQIHSDFDIETSHDVGASTMLDIIKKGSELKYEFLAFTEHNPSKMGHNKEQIVELLKKKREKVDQLNYSLRGKKDKSIHKVFNSLEIDINVDGTLPVPDEGLSTLDFALVSIHGSFRLPKDEMTKRVLSAMAHPKIKIFAHPTGRKIQEREGIDLNWEKVFEFCLENNKWIEINCDPMRLDLPDVLVREAVKLGIKMTLGTDAHHVDGMNNMFWGVSVARRGWCQKENILNTLSLNEFEKLLK